MRHVYLAATGQNRGKTTISLGVLDGFQKRGLAVGFINGYLVIRTDLPSFVVTLATLFAVAGLTLGFSIILAGSTSVALEAGPIAKQLFGEFVAGKFQVTVFWWIGAVVVLFLVGLIRRR